MGETVVHRCPECGEGMLRSAGSTLWECDYCGWKGELVIFPASKPEEKRGEG